MVWSQVYDPLNSTILSTLVCAIPVLVLLGGLGFFHIRAHYAAAAGLIAAAVIAVAVVGMPAPMTLTFGLRRSARTVAMSFTHSPIHPRGLTYRRVQTDVADSGKGYALCQATITILPGFASPAWRSAGCVLAEIFGVLVDVP